MGRMPLGVPVLDSGERGHHHLPELGLTRLRGPIRVKRSGSVKGVEDGQDRQALLA
jgi:hypothetical protein